MCGRVGIKDGAPGPAAGNGPSSLRRGFGTEAGDAPEVEVVCERRRDVMESVTRRECSFGRHVGKLRVGVLTVHKESST